MGDACTADGVCVGLLMDVGTTSIQFVTGKHHRLELVPYPCFKSILSLVSSVGPYLPDFLLTIVGTGVYLYNGLCIFIIQVKTG